MSTSATKSLRVRLSSALRDGFKERRWGKETLSVSMDLAPLGWVQAPLELVLSKEVDPAKYGGASVFASATIWSPQVADVYKLLPSNCLDELSESEVDEGTSLPTLAWIQLEELGPGWTAIQEEDLDTEVARFFDVVDGPLRQWASERSTPQRLLAVQATPGAHQTQVADLVRTMAILAVQQGLVDVARALVAGYVPRGADSEERFAGFEVELAKLLPAYGAPARS